MEDASQHESWKDWFRQHGPKLLLFARQATRTRADAEDVVQEALVKAYRSLDRYRDGAAFRPWLLRIVANETRNNHRAAVRRGTRERGVVLPPELLDPWEQVADRQGKEELLAAVASLPDRLRVVVTCRYLLELDEAETAAALRIPRGTVKSRLNRGLARLRERLAVDVREDARG